MQGVHASSKISTENIGTHIHTVLPIPPSGARTHEHTHRHRHTHTHTHTHDSLEEVGVEQVQHGSAVLATIEGHAHLLEPIPLVGLLDGGESVCDSGAERGREEGGHPWGEPPQQPLNLPLRLLPVEEENTESG